jgi:hypothetical protein
MNDMKATIANEFSSHLETIQTVIGQMENDLANASQIAVDTLQRKKRIAWDCSYDRYFCPDSHL